MDEEYIFYLLGFMGLLGASSVVLLYKEINLFVTELIGLVPVMCESPHFESEFESRHLESESIPFFLNPEILNSHIFS